MGCNFDDLGKRNKNLHCLMNQSINSKYNLTYLILFIVLVLSVYKQKQNSKQKKIARSVK